MKKRAFIGFFVILFMWAGIFSVSADSLIISTGTSLPSAESGLSYSATIEAEGGTAPYTFSFEEGAYVPSGLTIDSATGVISGKTYVTRSCTYSNIVVCVTDSQGETTKKNFSMTVYTRSVHYEISDNQYIYDGQAHVASIKPYIYDESGNKIDASDIVTNYEAKYANELSQTNVGAYLIKIQTKTLGYRTASYSNKYLFISKNTNAEIGFDNLEQEYDGSPKKPSVSVNGYVSEGNAQSLEYTLTYVGINTDYNSTEAPVNAGQYTVYCTITGENFATPAANSAVFTITKKSVNFELVYSPMTYGNEWNVEITNDSGLKSDEYSVTYRMNGIHYEEPINAGTYRVDIELSDNENYEIGVINPSTVTVNPKTVNFNIDPCVFGYDGTLKNPVITADVEGLSEGNDYTISYTKNGQAAELVQLGSYLVNIDMVNTNYVVGQILPTKIIVIEYEEIVFTGAESGEYSGEAQNAGIVNNRGLIEGKDYTIKYLKDGEEVTPVDAGEYTVMIQLSRSAQARYRIADAPETFTITPKPVDFTVSNSVVKYNAHEQYPNIVNNLDLKNYEVLYKIDGEAVTPVNAGEYSIEVVFDNGNYVVGEMNTAIFTILEDYHTVSLEFDADAGNVAITSEGASYQVEDVVSLSVSAKDGYKFIGWSTDCEGVTVSSDNTFIMPAQNITITAEFEKLIFFELGVGNSAYGMIERNSAVVDKEAAKTQFNEDRLYLSTKYSADAWGENDVDADEYAFIMYNRQSNKLPSVKAQDSEKNNIDNVTVKLYAGENEIDLTGLTRYTPQDIEPGIYRIEYSFYDTILEKTISTERTAVVLWNIGDANLDLNVNMADGNWIAENHENFAESNDFDRVRKYRICDVNKDGAVDMLDVEAINRRMINKLTEYYSKID